MISKKSLTYLLLFTAISVFVIIGFNVRSVRRAGVQNFEKFSNAYLNGQIDYVKIARKGVKIKLIDDSSSYIFYPIKSPDLNENTIFWHVAKHGDYVQKFPKADTLILVSDGSVLHYTFHRIK